MSRESKTRTRPGAIRFVRLLATVLTAACAGATGAQGYIRSTWPADRPTVTAEDLVAMERTLQLDDTQILAINALHEGYLAGFQDAHQRMRESENAIKNEARERQREDPGVWRAVGQQLSELREEWSERRLSLEQIFFTDVRTLLGPRQESRWSDFERDRRRRLTLSFGAKFAGEDVDLIALVDELDLTEETRQTLIPILEDYSNTLDSILRQRNDAIEESQRLLRSQEVEPSARLFDAIDVHRAAIRDLNERFALAMASRLPEPAAARLRRLFVERSFPRIFRETGADDYFDRALALETLTVDQRTTLEGMRRTYESDLAGINQQLVEVERRRDEERAAARREVRRQGRPDVGGDAVLRANEARELWRDRHNLVNEIVDRIHAALTPEQQRDAPKRVMHSPESGTRSLENGSHDR